MGSTVGKLVNEHNVTKDTEDFVPFIDAFLFSLSTCSLHVAQTLNSHVNGYNGYLFRKNKFIPRHYIAIEDTRNK